MARQQLDVTIHNPNTKEQTKQLITAFLTELLCNKAKDLPTDPRMMEK